MLLGSKIKFDTVLARWLVCFHCKGSTIKADVAEWQTRSAQDAVRAISWRFKSSHPHQHSLELETVLLCEFHAKDRY